MIRPGHRGRAWGKLDGTGSPDVEVQPVHARFSRTRILYAKSLAREKMRKGEGQPGDYIMLA